MGRDDEAVESLKKAKKADPLSAVYPARLSSLYNWLGRNDEAFVEANKSLELVEDFPIALWVLGSVYAEKGMFDKAIETHKKVGEISIDFKSSLGHTYALAGRKKEALAIAAELESQPKVWFTWGLAELYVALRDNDKTFYWLEKAFEQRHPYIQWIKRNPFFISIYDDPRFKDLEKRMNLPE